MHYQACSVPPSLPPAADPPSGPAPTAPGLGVAAGLIALYFALQLVASGVLALALGIASGFVHPTQGFDQVGPGIRAMLAQPGRPALLAIVTLGVAAGLTLQLAWRRWPALWPQARPPGFGFTLPWHGGFFALAIAVGLAAPLLGGWLTQLLAHGHPVTQNIEQLGMSTPAGWRVALALLATTLGPLVEELLFRGVLLSALLRRFRVGGSMAISALVFALAHLPGLQFAWYALPDLMLLALALAALRLASRSLWPAVLAHGVNNLLAVAAWFVVSHPH